MAALVDHTLLKPEATNMDVAALVSEERRPGGVRGVRISVDGARSQVVPDGRPGHRFGRGFPSGWPDSAIEAEEAGLAVEAGAQEIDMVIDIGAALPVISTPCASTLRRCCRFRETVVLKVIVEFAALLRLAGWPILIDVCRIADVRADFVKTSTGFHPIEASTEAVELMAATVGPSSGSRPAVVSGPRPMLSRCSRPVRPGWACRAPVRYSTVGLSAPALGAGVSSLLAHQSSRSGSRTW